MCEYVVEKREKPYVPKSERKEESDKPSIWKKDKNKCVNFENKNHDRLMGISKYLRNL